MSAGERHTCAILDNGDVKCWGSDSFGQLGDGGTITTSGLTTAPSSTAIDLGTGRTAVALSGSGYHTCAILDNGEAKCWGYDVFGNLGDASGNQNQASPVTVVGGYHPATQTYDSISFNSSTGVSSPITNVTGATCTVSPALPTGLSIDSSTCTISGTPTVATTNTTYTITANISNVTYQGGVWFSSSFLELTPSVEGADLLIDEAMTNITFQYNASAASGSGSVFAYANNKVSSNRDHTCTILVNGDLKCWGNDGYGQLGNSGANQNLLAPSSTAIPLGTGRTAVSVSTEHQHTCAILDNGDLKCWGWDNDGQLGTPGTVSYTHLTLPTT